MKEIFKFERKKKLQLQREKDKREKEIRIRYPEKQLPKPTLADLRKGKFDEQDY